MPIISPFTQDTDEGSYNIDEGLYSRQLCVLLLSIPGSIPHVVRLAPKIRVGARRSVSTWSPRLNMEDI